MSIYSTWKKHGWFFTAFPPTHSLLCFSVPGQPSKFQVGAVSDTSIELTWEAYEKEGIINYELRYMEGSFGTQVRIALFLFEHYVLYCQVDVKSWWSSIGSFLKQIC